MKGFKATKDDLNGVNFHWSQDSFEEVHSAHDI